jgi:TonB family protein
MLCFGSKVISQSHPVVKKESLKGIQFVSEITPALWPTLWMPGEQRNTLDQLSRMAYSGSFIYSNKYNMIIDYESVQIIATCYGKTLTAQGEGDALNFEQKNILNMADAGSDLMIKIRFRFKSGKTGSSVITKDIVEGNLTLTVLPEIEAEFPGGYLQVTDYFKKALKEKVAKSNAKNASIKFTVNENGVVSNARIGESSGNKNIDKILLEATTNMPKWKPARNSKGTSVKQEFHVMLGAQPVDGC